MTNHSFAGLTEISEGQNPYFPRLRKSEEPRLASHPRWSVVVPLPAPHHAPRLHALLNLPGLPAFRLAKHAWADAAAPPTESGGLRGGHPAAAFKIARTVETLGTGRSAFTLPRMAWAYQSAGIAVGNPEISSRRGSNSSGEVLSNPITTP